MKLALGAIQRISAPRFGLSILNLRLHRFWLGVRPEVVTNWRRGTSQRSLIHRDTRLRPSLSAQQNFGRLAQRALSRLPDGGLTPDSSSLPGVMTCAHIPTLLPMNASVHVAH